PWWKSWQAECPMPLSFPNIGNAAAVVGQTSRSARVFQDPLCAQRNQPYPCTKRQTWTSAAGLESCPTQLAQNGKTKRHWAECLPHPTSQADHNPGPPAPSSFNSNASMSFHNATLSSIDDPIPCPAVLLVRNSTGCLVPLASRRAPIFRDCMGSTRASLSPVVSRIAGYWVPSFT